MRILVYSSFTFSYLNRARVLYQTLKRFHPDWELVALITDEPPPCFSINLEHEPFDRIVWARELGIPDFESWLFQHDIVEACTAVKGPFILQACSIGVDAVIYLDPDTALFGSLEPLERLLEDYDIILTPHLIEPNDDPAAILDNDISASRTGIFNLGFVAIRTSGEGARFAKWWSERLLTYCFDDIPNGLFVDQRWCDHVPALFDKVKILRDPGYNVASWNLSRRRLSIGKDGSILVNGEQLRFWHFTKLGPLGDVMTKKYAGENFPVYEIWSWYKKQVAIGTESAIPQRWWAYESYQDGEPISKSDRSMYRARSDLQVAFPDPFRSGSTSFQRWLVDEGAVAGL